tara:strand:- start:224 stop:754 length:531 start_codon:yes stop_codon:yes gene_type:complete
MITPSIEANNIREAIKELKALDNTMLKAMRKDLRNSLSPFTKQIADEVPSDPPLSGFGDGDFGHSGATGWSSVKASVTFTPGRSRKGFGNHLVSVKINPGNKKRGVYIAELAGSRSNGFTAQGRSLIKVLNERQPMKGKGGRYAYSKFRLLRPDIVILAVMIVNKTIAKVNRKINF